MKKINPYLTGICMAYFSLGIAQLFSSHIFSHKIFLTIAAVSSSLAITELLKVVCKQCKNMSERWENDIFLLEKDLNKICDPLNKMVLSEKNLKKENLHNVIKEAKKNRKKENKQAEFIKKISSASIFIGYAFSMFFMVTIPFKNIPNDFMTNKVINASTLFCFGVMFVTLIINEAIDKENEDYLFKQELMNEKNFYIDRIYELTTKHEEIEANSN